MILMKCYNYDIVCQEIPGEITLAVNISGCPNRCPGCHSPWLAGDEGVPLDKEFLTLLTRRYGTGITCICFMGGDQNPAGINMLAKFVRTACPGLRTAWYSGLTELSGEIEISNFDYLKVGPYIEEFGGLRSPGTNQKFYRVSPDGKLQQIKFDEKNCF